MARRRGGQAVGREAGGRLSGWALVGSRVFQLLGAESFRTSAGSWRRVRRAGLANLP